MPYVIPQVGTSSQYTVPINANQPYLHPITRQSSVSENTPNVSISTSYVMSSVIQNPTAPPETSSNQQPPENT